AIAVGRYDDAEQAARRAARARDPERRRSGMFALARARQKRGDLEAAAEALARLREADPADAEAAGACARLLVSQGRYRQALEVAGGGGDHPLCLESAGLARLYLGDLGGADSTFAHLEQSARARADRPLLGRALGLRGMAAQSRGDVEVAARLYAEAAATARAAGEVHAAAVYDL